MAQPIEHDKPIENRTYETNSMLDAYLLFHFGDKSPIHFTKDDTNDEYALTLDGVSNVPNFGNFGYTQGNIHSEPFTKNFLSSIPNFPAACAQIAIHYYKQTHQTIDSTIITKLRAFDVGCAVGRTAFELAQYFPTVDGLDFSFNFVNAAKSLSLGERIEYKIPIEGDYNVTTEYKYDVIPNTTINFFQGDACELSHDIKYDCLVAANLIDRLPTPITFLSTLPIIINHGGIVVITSPYTWLEQYCSKEHWLTNLILDNNTGLPITTPTTEQQPIQKTTFEALRIIMAPHFNLIHHCHLPFYIHETLRKGQYSLSHCTIWQRK